MQIIIAALLLLVSSAAAADCTIRWTDPNDPSVGVTAYYLYQVTGTGLAKVGEKPAGTFVATCDELGIAREGFAGVSAVNNGGESSIVIEPFTPAQMSSVTIE